MGWRSSKSWDGFLAVLCAFTCWLSPLVLLLVNTVGVALPHGAKGLLASLVAAVSLALVPTWPLRMCCIAVHASLAATAPGGLQRCCALMHVATMTLFAWLCRGGRGAKGDFSPNLALSSFLCRGMKGYFDHCELRGELDGACTSKCCFGFHPHGAMMAGFIANGMFDEYFYKAGRVNWHVADIINNNPLMRWITDAVSSDNRRIRVAHRKTVLEVMATGENIAILPGGFQEAVAYDYGKERVVMKHRKGLIKYCMQFGYRLFPVYTFGESMTFRSFQGLPELRMKLSLSNLPMCFWWGRPLLPFMPLPEARLTTYIGAALDLPHVAEPTAEDVEFWHARYLEALRQLFEEKRADAGFPDAVLEFY